MLRRLTLRSVDVNDLPRLFILVSLELRFLQVMRTRATAELYNQHLPQHVQGIIIEYDGLLLDNSALSALCRQLMLIDANSNSLDK